MKQQLVEGIKQLLPIKLTNQEDHVLSFYKSEVYFFLV